VKALVVTAVGAEGAPDLPGLSVPLTGWVWVGTFTGAHALYVVTSPDLGSVAAEAVAVLALTEPTDGGDRWPEVDAPVPEAALAALNDLLAGIGRPALPASVTPRQAALSIASQFDVGAFDVADATTD